MADTYSKSGADAKFATSTDLTSGLSTKVNTITYNNGIADAKARANHTGTQTSATISDFTEAVQDAVAAFFVAGANVTSAYNDAAGTLTLTVAAGGSSDPEAIRDAIGAALVSAGPISITVNDAGDTITISSSATVNSTDAALRDRSTHTGTQAASTITGLATVATSGSYADLNGKPTIPSATPSATDITGRLPGYGQPPTSFVLEPAPTSPPVIAGDDFTGTAGTSLVGRSSNLGTAATWTVVSGTWQLNGSGAVSPTTNTDNLIATLALPSAYATQYTVEVTAPYRVTGTTAANRPGLIIRYVDANNYWFVNPQPSNGYITLVQVVSGSQLSRAQFPFPAGVTDGTALTYRVDVWQDDMTIFVNGVEQTTYTSPTTGVGSAVVGIRQGIFGGYTTPVAFSNFKISVYKGVKYNFPRLGTTPSYQILPLGTSGSWDDTDLNNPNVFWDPNNLRWTLYYSGFKTSNGSVRQGLGLAYADNLNGPWVKDNRNPIVDFSNNNVENGALVWTAGRWLRVTENVSVAAKWYTSPDLITWTQITPTGLTTAVHDPFMRINQFGLLELWYGSGSPSTAIYRATSTDGGLTWNAPTTPVLSSTPLGNGTFRGNGEPTMYSLPGKEGVEMVILVDVAEAQGKGLICAAITTDSGATWHWRNVAGGSGSGFDSAQKFDSFPVFAEGGFHMFHSGAPILGSGVSLQSTIGHMAMQWTPNPRSIVTYAPTIISNVTLPVITGTTLVGSVLTASAGTWLPTPDSFTYQWTRNGTPIAGATASTYTLVSADNLASVAVVVTAVKANFANVSATSAALIIGALTNTAAPTITGTGTIGNTLTVSTGTWTPTPDSYTYQWTRGGTPISGATASTYQIVNADALSTVAVAVTAVKASYPSATVTATGIAVGAIPTTMQDTFTRADNTTSLGSTETGQTWTVLSGGTFGINSNRAYRPVAGSTPVNDDYAVIEAGKADVDVSVTAAAMGTAGVGVVFRATDVSNLWFVDCATSLGMKLTKRSGGTNTSMQTLTATFAVGDVIRVVTSGANISVYQNGVQVGTTFTDAFNQTATKHGIRIGGSNASGGAHRLDNFILA